MPYSRLPQNLKNNIWIDNIPFSVQIHQYLCTQKPGIHRPRYITTLGASEPIVAGCPSWSRCEQHHATSASITLGLIHVDRLHPSFAKLRSCITRGWHSDSLFLLLVCVWEGTFSLGKSLVISAIRFRYLNRQYLIVIVCQDHAFFPPECMWERAFSQSMLYGFIIWIRSILPKCHVCVCVWLCVCVIVYSVYV